MINITGLAVALTCVLLSILYYEYEHSYNSFHKNGSHIYRITTTYKDNQTGEWQRGAGTAQVQGPVFKSSVPEILEYARIFGGDIQENVKSADKAFTLGAAFADTGLFKMFSFPFLAGDPATALSNKSSVVITETTAKKFFETTDAIGKRLDVEDNPDSLFASFTVAGVVKDPPANSSIQFDIVIPFSYLQGMWNDDGWLNNYLPTFVLLRPDANVDALPAKFNAIHAVHAKEQQEKARLAGEFDKQVFYSVEPLSKIHLSREGGFANSSKPVYSGFLLGISIFILLMASINFINLNIGGSLKRAREIGVRKVSGSSKVQIIFQFLVESFLMCLLAIGIACLITQQLLPFFNQLADRDISVEQLMNWRLVMYVVCLLTANVLLSGLYPAWVLAKFKPTQVLYNKPLLTGKNWLGKLLVVLQFAIATCLIIGSIIYYRQMNFIHSKDLGYNPENIIRIGVPFKRDIKHVFSVMKNELAKESAVKQVSFESNVQGANVHANGKDIKVNYKSAESSYIPMLEIKIRQGRNFLNDRATDKTKAAIVNEAFVKLTGLANPLGSEIKINEWYSKETMIVIGVVKDYHTHSLKEDIQPEVIVQNSGTEGTILVKIDRSKQLKALTAIEKAYHLAVPGSEYRYTFWDDHNHAAYASEQKWKQIIATATIVSILICCLGLFGLTHLATQMRVKELGIRKVLGASAIHLAALVSLNFIRLIGISVFIASPFAWYFMNGWLQNFAYRIDIGWWIFATGGLIALIIAILTIGFQSIKAALANPAQSLRTE